MCCGRRDPDRSRADVERDGGAGKQVRRGAVAELALIVLPPGRHQAVGAQRHPVPIASGDGNRGSDDLHAHRRRPGRPNWLKPSPRAPARPARPDEPVAVEGEREAVAGRHGDDARVRSDAVRQPGDHARRAAEGDRADRPAEFASLVAADAVHGADGAVDAEQQGVGIAGACGDDVRQPGELDRRS